LWGACLALSIWTLFAIYLAGYIGRFSSPSVNIVIAATNDTNYRWLKNVTIPNKRIIPYFADDQNATYHPLTNKGNEALVYLSYLYEHYDILPEISIFLHGHERAWHHHALLEGSMLYTLNHLDLTEVFHRQYLNLHVDWPNACPDWINTAWPFEDPIGKPEGPFMEEAFMANFPGDPLPQFLNQPCCSQFAVTRKAIRSVPREQYKQKIDWLLNVEMDNSLVGRIWEHMWQYLFLKKPVDCPIEYKALCRGWHICFENQEIFLEWNEIWHDINGPLGMLVDEWRAEHYEPNAPTIGSIKRKMARAQTNMREMKEAAIRRGSSRKERANLAWDLDL